MDLHQYKEYEGRTMGEIAKTAEPRTGGYAVFALPKDDDLLLGEFVDESFSVAEIINHHPELENWIVKYTNGYFDEIVLRVAEPEEK